MEKRERIIHLKIKRPQNGGNEAVPALSIKITRFNTPLSISDLKLLGDGSVLGGIQRAYEEIKRQREQGENTGDVKPFEEELALLRSNVMQPPTSDKLN